MHTPSQGLIYTFKFSAVLIICSLYECSLPSVPFPLFPSLVPYQKQSVVFVTHTSPLLSKSVHSLPSSSSHCSLPSFPIDDYVPALFPYWRLCSRPLSLFSIMLLLPFPIFDYVPDDLCPWCPYVTFTRLLKVQFYVVSTWVNGPDNYYLCTELCSIFPHYF